MSRIQSIDTFRIFAIIAVISLHTTPFHISEGSSIYRYLDVLINQGARFAVPFFFVLSGYFYARKIKSGSEITPTTINLLKRLGAIWLFFTIIYILPYDFFSAFEYGVIGPAKVIYWNLRKIVNDPVEFIFEGSKVHLWFLVSLSLSVLITSLSSFIGQNNLCRH